MALTLTFRQCSNELARDFRRDFDFPRGSQIGMDADQRLDESVRAGEFDQAFALLQKLVDWSEADELHPVRDNAVYRTSVVLWMLIRQPMNPDSSLEAAVKKLLEERPDCLPENRRVTSGTLSTNTGGYSKARTRMPVDAAKWLAQRVGQSLMDLTPPSFGARRVFMLDGTTITLAPVSELRRQFPPGANQYGENVWPVAMLVMVHELSSGAALIPAIGAKFGDRAVSETALVASCLDQLPADSVVLADANFGIFSVAQHTQAAGQKFLFRMTTARFESLRRQATLVESTAVSKTYALAWHPSHKDRQTHPELTAETLLSVKLHEVTLYENLTLMLVTNLTDSATALGELYHHRLQIEIDIRNFKVVLDAERLRSGGLEMFYKELYASLVSYNLVTQFRRQAAAVVDLPPRRLSFKRTWTTFRTFLFKTDAPSASDWRARFDTALRYATQDQLPNRPDRQYPREADQRRTKSQHFKKRTPPPNLK